MSVLPRSWAGLAVIALGALHCASARTVSARVASSAHGRERTALQGAAESAAERAFRAVPDRARALHQRALIVLQSSPSDREPQRRALALVDRALQSAASEASAPFDREARAALWNTRGVLLWRSGDARGAIASFERAIDRCSSAYEPWINLANARAFIGEFAGAMAAFVGAAARTRTDDERYDVMLGEATARRALQQWREADALLDRALALRASRPEAYFNRALSALYSGSRDEQLRSVWLVREFERLVTEHGRTREFSTQLDVAHHWELHWQRLHYAALIEAMRASNEASEQR